MLKLKSVLLISIMAMTLAACKGNTSGEEKLSIIVEANTNDSIWKEYLSVMRTCEYANQEDTDTTYDYISSNIVFCVDAQDSAFTYMDENTYIYWDEEAEAPIYGVITDSDEFKGVFESFSKIHFIKSDVKLFTETGDAAFTILDEGEENRYTVDPANHLIKGVEIYDTEDNSLYCTETYDYSTDNNDIKYRDRAFTAVNQVSDGETVKLDLKMLDGSIRSFDFPKGCIAVIYGENDFGYDGMGDTIYGDEVIIEDTVLYELGDEE